MDTTLSHQNLSGEDNRGIVNRVKWKMRFIGKRTSLGGTSELGLRREVEALIGCIVLNLFTELGRCQSELVA